MTLNFKVKNIVSRIEELTKAGLNAAQQAILASQKFKEEDGGILWQKIFTPLDKSEFSLTQAMSMNAHINTVSFDEKFNKEYEKTLVIVENYKHKINTNQKLYQAFLNLKRKKLSTSEHYILANIIRDFKLSGLELKGKKLARFKEINARLTLAKNQFATNGLKATNSWQKTLTLDALGKNYPKSLAQKLKSKNGYEINLQAPIYLEVMAYSDNRALREELYRAYISRASEIGITDKKYDNRALIDEILHLRDEKAKLLGLKHYAEYSLATKMLQDANTVENFLKTLIARIKPQAKKELKAVRNFANKILKPWDLMFFSEQLKQKLYGFSENDLMPYFPENKVLSGLFKVIEKLYGICIYEAEEQTYDKSVRVIILENAHLKNSHSKNNDSIIGKIYLDIYARKNKRQGAWMADYQGLYYEKNTTHKPIAFVVCNLNQPTKDKPALFTFNEVLTLFHEFGHALHHILTETPHPSVAGINGVPWDAVEMPSQMMELFCYEREVIDLISGHYKTGVSLPSKLFHPLIEAKKFNVALMLLRQCEFALFDIRIHLKNSDCYQTLAQVQRETALIKNIEENRFLNTFDHIFSGGYAAGYYSYLWAEILASDAFMFIKTHGIFNQKILNDFKTHILAVGGSADFMEQYKKFRGTKPDISALLKVRGIEN